MQKYLKPIIKTRSSLSHVSDTSLTNAHATSEARTFLDI